MHVFFCLLEWSLMSFFRNYFSIFVNRRDRFICRDLQPNLYASLLAGLAIAERFFTTHANSLCCIQCTKSNNMQTMKNTKPWIQLTRNLSLAVAVAVVGIGDLDAKGKRGPHGPKGRGDGPGKSIAGMNPDELGALRDQFAAYQKQTAGGMRYYVDANKNIRFQHKETYESIQRSLAEDRITEEEGREFVAELLAIGENAKEMRGGAAALSADQVDTVSGNISDLRGKIKKARKNDVAAEMLTPRLNRMQSRLEELNRFGVDTNKLSAGQSSSLRRKLDSLESKEASAKSDGNVSTSELEKLHADVRDVFKYALKSLGS